MARIDDMWRDIVSGKIPLMYDSDGRFLQGLSPISEYSDYESDEEGAYDLTVFTVDPTFFGMMEQKCALGAYKKYDLEGDDIKDAANKAWSQVWKDKSEGTIARAFTKDYESTVPAEYTKDHRAHCFLYIAVR